MIVALVNDLLFESKITATAAQSGHDVCVLRRAGNLDEVLPDATGLVLDLNLDGADALEVLRGVKANLPDLPVVAFLSHVQVDLARAARGAGADRVFPRSKFVEKLPEILGRLASGMVD